MGPTQYNTITWQWETDSFWNTSPWEQQADTKRNSYGSGKRSPLLHATNEMSPYNITWLFVSCSGLLPLLAPPSTVWRRVSTGSVLPHHALSQARSSLPRHLELSVTRFKCFKILHFQSKNKQSQCCVTENALNTRVLLLTVNRTWIPIYN